MLSSIGDMYVIATLKVKLLCYLQLQRLCLSIFFEFQYSDFTGEPFPDDNNEAEALEIDNQLLEDSDS